ncbi:MAG: tail fiber domain-containing protein [Candidatus Udaeobacter sp.]
MKNQTKMWMTILPVLACFALLSAQAVSPAPDGCYPNLTTAEGCGALNSLTTGAGNTALGWRSLLSTTDGSFNTGAGAGALALNNGSSNTAVGVAALLLNTAGSNNTAVGTGTLLNNTTDRNTAVGANALNADNSGTDNCGVGFEALTLDTTGGANTAVGRGALDQNVIGNFNTAIGKDAGGLATGSGNVYIGHLIAGVAGENNHTYIRNIKDTSVNGGGADIVTIDLTTGLLGHASSSRRYKEDIRPMEQTSEALYRLHPVTFRYKKEIDRTQSTAFGLIAEEVAKVNPNLIARNSQGQPESVHYEMVNAMLLNEFLKEHQTVQELKATAAQQKSQIDALTAGLQKVSAQLEMSKPAPKVVANKP